MHTTVINFFLIYILVCCNFALAQSPTQAQIDQFRNLSPAEQRALAEAYGININSILSQQNQSRVQESQAEEVSGFRSRNSETERSRRNNNTNQAPIDDPFFRGLTGANSDNIDQIQEISEEGTDLLNLEEDQAEEATNEKLTLYGHDIFNQGADAFVPATDIPIPSDYVLGPGDSIIIQLYGKENSSHTLSITREGNIQFPNIGPVVLAGLSFDQASKKIAEIVSQQMIGIKSSVTLGSLRSIRVFILGEAKLPGSYVVHSLSTLTNAIMASGGVSDIGSLRNIQLKRSGKVVSTFDFYDLLLNGDTSGDARLLPGDVIFIPTIGRTVSVSGEVKRPAIYELDREKTVAEVLNLAGGPLPTAFLPETRIERLTDDGEKTLINVNAKTNEGLSTKVKDADVIQIFSALDTLDDIVLLKGHVKRPGGFKWRPGMYFTDIVKSIEELSPNPDMNAGVIRHVDPATRRISVSFFSLNDAWQNPKSALDPLLRNRDTIFLFSFDDDRNFLLSGLVEELSKQAEFGIPRKVVAARGNIRSPGFYPFFENMNAQDLIRLAGGLLESSSGINAEITRQVFDHEHNRNQKHFNFDLRKENPELLAGDSLTIQQIPFWKETKTVEIVGEVISPGIYTILPGETLTEVIERAGGLSPYAYIDGTTYSRQDLRDLEQQQLEALREDIQKEILNINLNKSTVVEGVSQEETNDILDNIENAEVKGFLVINLRDILTNPEEYDFELEDGDIITVPAFKPTVTVVGEVQHSTSHFYDARVSLDDYIESSGGTKRNADDKRIFVVRANGQVIVPRKNSWFKRNSVEIKPGDTIVVPIDAGKADPIKIWASFASILSQTAVGIAAIRSL